MKTVICNQCSVIRDRRPATQSVLECGSPLPLSHPPSGWPGFTLQSTDSLSPTNWGNAPSGTNNPATVPATLPARFYRLTKP